MKGSPVRVRASAQRKGPAKRAFSPFRGLWIVHVAVANPCPDRPAPSTELLPNRLAGRLIACEDPDAAEVVDDLFKRAHAVADIGRVFASPPRNAKPRRPAGSPRASRAPLPRLTWLALKRPDAAEADNDQSSTARTAVGTLALGRRAVCGPSFPFPPGMLRKTRSAPSAVGLLQPGEVLPARQRPTETPALGFAR